jgi:NifU-like protein involved in Fe-S cluster formation
MLQGKGKPEGVDLGDVEALEGVSKFPVRVKCALLPWATLAEALARPEPRPTAAVSTESAGETADRHATGGAR